MTAETKLQDSAKSSIENPANSSLEAQNIEESPDQITYPDRGVRAWFVVLGASGVLFSTYGYANAFGFVKSAARRVHRLTDRRVFQEYYQLHQLKNETSSGISWIGSLQVYFLLSATLIGGPLFDRYGEKVRLYIPEPFPYFANTPDLLRSSGHRRWYICFPC